MLQGWDLEMGSGELIYHECRCYETEFTEESSQDSRYTRVYVQEECFDLLGNGRCTA